MVIQIRADETSEIIRNQTRGFERNLLPLCDLSNLCISGTDTNNRMARTSKKNIIYGIGIFFLNFSPACGGITLAILGTYYGEQ